MTHVPARCIAVCLTLLLAGMCALSLRAQPQPGDVFREYAWTKHGGDAGGALRVGGKQGESRPGDPPDWHPRNEPIALGQDLDLEHATRAEVVIEKLLCHDGTRGLSIRINRHDWISVPESQDIPAPQWDYQHHTCPTVPVPVSCLKNAQNRFELRVSPEHPWKWPQSLIYGVIFRIYYDAARKPHPTGRLLGLKSQDTIGRAVFLEAQAGSPNGRIQRLDYIGHYEDVNYEGDGRYRQWHDFYFRGGLLHHLGTARTPPYRLTWDTAWVPDQKEAVRLAARVVDETGLTWFTPAVEGLKLVRPGLSVELCKPFDVPKKWVTRSGEHQERFRITGDLQQALAAQLVWSSWSPGYMNGVFINDRKVLDSQGPRYAYYFHRVAISDLAALKAGENLLKTGRTPPHNGATVHGMEVNWPGMMVLIQFQNRLSLRPEEGYVFGHNERTWQQIEDAYAQMPPVEYSPPPERWTHLARTARRLEGGPVLRVVMLGDSIVNDTSRSGWDMALSRRYPKCRIEKITSVRGSTGCRWYKENSRVKTFVLDHGPDLVIIGGISHGGDIDSIREVIRQIRQAGCEADILLMSGAFGSVDPRDDRQWQERIGGGRDAYREGLHQLADETGSAFLDMTAAWGRYIRASGKDLDWFKRDSIHANERGEQILGRILDRFLAP